MDALIVILKGLIVGMLIAAPTGPTGIICIKRILKSKGKGGYLTSLGIALADSFYSLIAVFGILTISEFVVKEKASFQIIGGSFLIALGFWEFFGKKNQIKKEYSKKKEKLKDFLVGFLVTIVNPITILSFFALYASLGLGIIARDFWMSIVLVLSTFIGSFLVWSSISYVVSKKKHLIPKRFIQKINTFFGVLFLLIGTLIFLKLFFLSSLTLQSIGKGLLDFVHLG
jgi:threonine/homoserine/homoserine lactone efflux protein